MLYDEHGGFYDHMTPPRAMNLTGEAYSPNTTPGFRVKDPTFHFGQLGVRVPALIISPWVEPGHLDHSLYDHTSLVDAAIRLIGFPIGERLHCRIGNPATFADLFTLSAPRDAPRNLMQIFERFHPDYSEEAG